MKSHDEKAMNANRAREMFSQIHEGVADEHTRKVFDRALEQDPSLRDEYADFVRAIEILTEMAAEPIEVPVDLHERISARVDKHVWDAGQVKKRWFVALPNWAVGGLATAAVAASVFAVVLRSNATGPNTSHLLPVTSKAQPKAGFTYAAGKVHLSVTSPHAVTVTVKKTADDVVVGTYDVTDKSVEVDAPLINNEAAPVGLTVSFNDGQAPLYVVLPGTDRDATLTGEGDLTRAAKAVAAHFGTPVVIQDAGKSFRTFRWAFDSNDTAKDIQTRLSDAGMSVEIINGILRLSEN